MEKQASHVLLCMLLLFLTHLPYSLGRPQQDEGLIKSRVNDEEQSCKYLVKVQTSETTYPLPANHQVQISLCWDIRSCFLVVPDLRQYGDRGPNYGHYFDKGAFSTFEINTRDWCYDTCKISVVHLSQEGGCPQWTVDYIQVQAFNNWGTKKYDEFFPIYGTLAPGAAVDVSKCPIRRFHGKNLDVEDHGVTPLFT